MVYIAEELVNFTYALTRWISDIQWWVGKASQKSMIIWFTFYIFKYRQNYVVCCLSVQTNTVKLYINEKDNLKIQESGSFLSLKEGKE